MNDLKACMTSCIGPCTWLQNLINLILFYIKMYKLKLFKHPANVSKVETEQRKLLTTTV